MVVIAHSRARLGNPRQAAGPVATLGHCVRASSTDLTLRSLEASDSPRPPDDPATDAERDVIEAPAALLRDAFDGLAA
jgi:hypothetical protein